MAALEDLRAENAELAARVAAYEASEKEEKRRIEKAMDRAEQKIRAAASKVERMAKKHEDEGRELEEKRTEVARLYKDCRESRESSDKYKFEWDRSKEEVAELNDRIMRQHTEHARLRGLFRDLGHLPRVSADEWTSDHLSERPRSVHPFSGARARGTVPSKLRRIARSRPRSSPTPVWLYSKAAM